MSDALRTNEEARVCSRCLHVAHGDEECDAEAGYDHLNGSHECGCTGARLSDGEREALADLLHSHIGFYLSEDAENALVGWIEERLGRQPDVEDEVMFDV